MVLADLRKHAIAASLFAPTTLRRAMGTLGFVQADPIRCPARAQDLILRHRVADYRVGDLDRAYRKLALEEDYLYAYGFMPRATWQLLHPRPQRDLSASESETLAAVSARKGSMHPRELGGKNREENAWGGYSSSTTRDLERLHYLGKARVAGRLKGIKLYEKGAAITHEPFHADERLRRLTMLIAAILAPLPESSLRAALRHLRYSAPELEGRRQVVGELIRTGELASAQVESVRFVWPQGDLIRAAAVEPVVKFLAPFDPLVWDRARFELFWGWRYRFEAYTPAGKRKLGYYAMPMLWKNDVVGWVNVEVLGDTFVVRPGFVRDVARERGFRVAFNDEVESMGRFLGLANDAGSALQ